MGDTLNLEIKNPVPVLYEDIHTGEAIYDPLDPDQKRLRLVWMENVIPTKEGLATITKQSYITDTIADIQVQRPTDVHAVYDENDLETYYTLLDDTHYIVNRATGNWDSLGVDGTVNYGSVAYINGRSYIFKSSSGVSSFAPNFTALVPETLTGITPTAMDGMTNALNYLILFDKDTVYWSAPGDPNEFRPLVGNVTTGAGSSKLQDAQGPLVAAYPIAEGFIVYTTRNMVGARYSGDSINPWIFKEIDGSSGIQRYDRVAADENLDRHFAITTSGLQEINFDRATMFIPEVSDFLAGKRYFESNHDGTFTKIQLEGIFGEYAGRIRSKMKVVSHRFLCISYGSDIGPMDWILILDTQLNSWGHIYAPEHLDVFEFFDILNEPYKDFDYFSTTGPSAFGYLKLDGTVTVVRMAQEDRPPENEIAIDGELILGSLRTTRNSLYQVSKVILHGDRTENTPVHVLTTDTDGIRANEVEFIAGPKVGDYLGDTTGVSHRIRVTGNFDLTSIESELSGSGMY